MDPIRIFYWEGASLFALAASVVAWKAILKREVLAGLVRDGFGRVSVVQVQLVIVTLALSGRYLWAFAQTVAAGRHAMPTVGAKWLTLYGLSGAVYGAGLWLRGLRGR